MYSECMLSKTKVDFHSQRSEEPWCRRYADCMCGWPDRLPKGNLSGISRDRDSAVHHQSDQKYNKVCFL